jgi:hypothetical protein
MPPRPLPQYQYPEYFEETQIVIYLRLEHELPQSINKRRKEIQRELQEIRQNFPEIEKWAEDYTTRMEWDGNQARIQALLEQNDLFIQEQIQQVLEILEQQGFIRSQEINIPFDESNRIIITETEYILQPLGQIAAPLSEVPSLLFAKALPNLKFLDTKDWILLFSCFTGTLSKTQDEIPDPHALL